MSRQGTQKEKKRKATDLDTFTRAPEEQPKKYQQTIKSVDLLAFLLLIIRTRPQVHVLAFRLLTSHRAGVDTKMGCPRPSFCSFWGSEKGSSREAPSTCARNTEFPRQRRHLMTCICPCNPKTEPVLGTRPPRLGPVGVTRTAMCMTFMLLGLVFGFSTTPKPKQSRAHDERDNKCC